MVIALGHDDDQPGSAAVSEPGVNRSRHQVDVDAARENGEQRPPFEVGAGGRGRRRLAQVVELDRRRGGRELGGADQAGLGKGRGPQPALGRQPVVRVDGRSSPAVALDHGHDPCESVARGLVSVHHALGLAVVLSNADLEHRPMVVDDRPGHFESEDLAAQHPVLDNRLGAGGADHVDKGFDVGIEERFGRQRRGCGGRQPGAVDAPDGGRVGEGGGTPGKRAGVRVDEDVKILERKALRPEQRLAQGALRLLVGVDPPGAVLYCRAVCDQRGPTGEALRTPLCLAPLPSDEGAQLGLAEALPPFVLGYFLFPLRAP